MLDEIDADMGGLVDLNSEFDMEEEIGLMASNDQNNNKSRDQHNLGRRLRTSIDARNSVSDIATMLYGSADLAF